MSASELLLLGSIAIAGGGNSRHEHASTSENRYIFRDGDIIAPTRPDDIPNFERGIEDEVGKKISTVRDVIVSSCGIELVDSREILSLFFSRYRCEKDPDVLKVCDVDMPEIQCNATRDLAMRNCTDIEVIHAPNFDFASKTFDVLETNDAAGVRTLPLRVCIAGLSLPHGCEVQLSAISRPDSLDVICE